VAPAGTIREAVPSTGDQEVSAIRGVVEVAAGAVQKIGTGTTTSTGKGQAEQQQGAVGVQRLVEMGAAIGREPSTLEARDKAREIMQHAAEAMARKRAEPVEIPDDDEPTGTLIGTVFPGIPASAPGASGRSSKAAFAEVPQREVLRTPTVADARSIRRREDGPMSHVRRFDHVGLTVADLDVVTAFFVALGLEVEGRTFVEGEFLDTVCGIPDSRTEIVMLKPPDDGTRLELSSFVRPDSVPGSPAAMANELGLRNVAFEVNDLQAAVDWAATEGYGLVGGIGEYEGAWRMAYVRGPEGIIVSLAERIG
jgi:catechol 2,3-dioxygenase-like lactoylglutathione lyase family enzyme